MHNPFAGFPVIDGRILLDSGPSVRGWHFHEDFLRCPQLWAYRVKLRLVFPSTVPLVRGSLFHLGVAHYGARLYLAQNGLDVGLVHEPHEAMRILTHLEDEKLAKYRDDGQPYRRGERYAHHLDLTMGGVSAAIAHHSRITEKVLAVEHQLLTIIPEPERARADLLRDSDCPVGKRVGHHPLGAEHEGYACTCPGGYLYSQRPDLIVEDQDGWVWIVDWKTRGRKDPRQARGYAMSGQFHGYTNFGRMYYGERFGGLVASYLTWGDPDRGKRHKVDRERVPVSNWAAQCLPDSLRWSERSMAALEGTDPWRYPKVFVENGGCETRYGPCPGRELCALGPAALSTLDHNPYEKQDDFVLEEVE